MQKAVNTYLSTCCNAPATKTPLVAPKDKSKRINGLPSPDDCGTLGKWRCGNCKRRCKVTPQKNA